MAKQGLQGLRVVALTSRRGDELAELVRRQGGEPLVVPVVAEVPLDDTGPALAFAEALLAGKIDVVILLTGGGVRLLADVIEARHPRAAWLAALARTTAVARSGKPAAALRGLGGPPPQVVARAPHTAGEILAALDGMSLTGRHVAIQEYGEGNPELLAGLAARGARVTRVPTYQWALPADTGPLRAALDEIIAGRVHAVLFTSPRQADHLLQVAAAAGREPELRQALPRVVVAVVGPSTRAALERHGLPVDLEPEHPRMGHLVHTLGERLRPLLSARGRG